MQCYINNANAYTQYTNIINHVVNDKCGDKCVSALLHISHIALANQNFGTNRFLSAIPEIRPREGLQYGLTNRQQQAWRE